MRVLILFFFVLCRVEANDWQSHDSILTAARQYLALNLGQQSEFTIQLRPLDNRLQFRHCQQPLVATVPNDKHLLGNTAVQVKCVDSPGWQIYVNAEIQAVQQVVVAVRSLPRGSRLQAEDVMLLRWPSHLLRGAAFLRINDVVGLTVKNTLTAQVPITSSQLCLICKGDTVQMLAGDGRFSVGISGIAQGYGNLGETVRVLNPSSRRQVSGIVAGPGLVRVGG